MNTVTADNPYRESINVLTEAFKFFNQKLENGRLATPVITVLPRGKKRAYGWFWPNKWTIDGKPVSEISISAETLNRNPAEVLETLIHEIAHYANDVDKIVDATNNYHNKHFKKKAESYGLTVTKMGAVGWGITTNSDRSKALIDEFMKASNFTEFKLQRKTASSGMYKKLFYVNVDEDVKTNIKRYAEQEGMSERDFVYEILTHYQRLKRDGEIV